MRYYLVIASEHGVAGYRLDPVAAEQIPAWQTNSRLLPGGQALDLESKPPAPIP